MSEFSLAGLGYGNSGGGMKFNPATGRMEPIQPLPFSNANGSYGPHNPEVNPSIPTEMNNWQKFGLGANAITGLAGAYSAYKQLGLMEDQLGMQRNLANRNIANSAATTNAQLERGASIGAQMTTGARQGDEAYELAKERLYRPVDGSPVV